MNKAEIFEHPSDYDLGAEYHPGIYYWFAEPGCLPDSDPYGPFVSVEAAEREVGDELAEELPQDEDIVLSDGRGGKTVVSVVGGKCLGEFRTYDDAIQFVREHRKRSNWFPTVWFMSDHGNLNIVGEL